MAQDGARLVKAPGGSLKMVQTTRWAELGDVVRDMSMLATAIGSPTHFHLLNPDQHGQFFTVADTGRSCIKRAAGGGSAKELEQAMLTCSRYSTPLTQAVQQIHSQVAPAAAQLAAKGQQVVLVLCTDGRPDEPPSFLRALQELQRLPVWVVVRLCTSDADIVDYWSDLDKSLERPLEVLDDVAGEAQEVHKKNPWLTYAPALHLARTMGLQDKLFDLMDETALLPSQAKQLCERILGCGELPEPEVDPEGFRTVLREALTRLPPVYSPVKQAMAPWVDVDKVLGGGACIVS